MNALALPSGPSIAFNATLARCVDGHPHARSSVGHTSWRNDATIKKG